MPPDPIQEFEHDHARFSKLVSELREHVLAAQRGASGIDEAVLPALEHLREDLFLHYAREEEGLFPYIVERLPETRDAVGKLVAAHDGICGTLSRMVHRAGGDDRDADLGAVVSLFERFESAYADHAREEVGFLRDLGPRLTAQQRDELRDLLRGL